MKIEHVAMYVKDLDAVRDYFVTYFGGHADEGYWNKKTGFRSHFITFDGGPRLEIMHRPGMDDPKKVMARTGFIHISFSVGSKEKVDAITERIRSAGYKVLSEPRTTGDGYYESCVADPEGNQIEITV